jgi:hypothetical protein
MNETALCKLVDETGSHDFSDDSDEERVSSSTRDYSDKWFHPDNIRNDGTMSSRSRRTTKAVRPTNAFNEFQCNALTVTMCTTAVFLTIKLGSPRVPSINNAVDWPLHDRHPAFCRFHFPSVSMCTRTGHYVITDLTSTVTNFG